MARPRQVTWDSGASRVVIGRGDKGWMVGMVSVPEDGKAMAIVLTTIAHTVCAALNAEIWSVIKINIDDAGDDSIQRIFSAALKSVMPDIAHHLPGVQGSVGTAVKILRKLKGLTAEKLAEASGLSRGTISEIENDKANMTLDSLGKIALALDVKPGDLLNAIG